MFLGFTHAIVTICAFVAFIYTKPTFWFQVIIMRSQFLSKRNMIEWKSILLSQSEQMNILGMSNSLVFALKIYFYISNLFYVVIGKIIPRNNQERIIVTEEFWLPTSEPLTFSLDSPCNISF